MFFELLLYKLIDILDFGMVHFDLKQNVAKHVRIPPKPKPKKRRVGRYTGLTNRSKKAIVTLKDGQTIDLG